MGQGINAHTGLVNNAPRDAHHGAVGGDIPQQHGAGANAGVGPHGDRPQDLGTRTDHHVLLEGWVTFAVLFAGTAQGHPLVQQAVVADDRSLANHHPHAMVDEDATANAGAWVDFDAGEQPSHLAQQPWQQGNTQSPQTVADAMHDQGMEARVAKQDLQGAAGCGIPFLDDGQIGRHRLEDGGERAHQTARRPISLRSWSMVAVPR